MRSIAEAMGGEDLVAGSSGAGRACDGCAARSSVMELCIEAKVLNSLVSQSSRGGAGPQQAEAGGRPVRQPPGERSHNGGLR